MPTLECTIAYLLVFGPEKKLEPYIACVDPELEAPPDFVPLTVLAEACCGGTCVPRVTRWTRPLAKVLTLSCDEPGLCFKLLLFYGPGPHDHEFFEVQAGKVTTHEGMLGPDGLLTASEEGQTDGLAAVAAIAMGARVRGKE